MPEVHGSRGTAPETIPPSFISHLRSLLRSSWLLSPVSPIFFFAPSRPSLCLVRELPARKIPLSSPPPYLLLRRLHSHPVERDSRINLRALDNTRSVLSLTVYGHNFLDCVRFYAHLYSFFLKQCSHILKNLFFRFTFIREQ